MKTHETFMQRCIELAQNGLGHTAPNPLVGCVIEHENEIIAEGWHREYGGDHAERIAISSIQDNALIGKSTLYVNLEPCNHKGKTPPCCDLIVESGLRKVVIGCSDPNEHAGSGAKKLRSEGIEVIEGIMQAEAREVNKRFLTYYEEQRPYVILKWAQTMDGFIDKKRSGGKPSIISGELSQRISHKWRTEEQSIMIGTNTARLDDSLLTARYWKGPDPLRVTVDVNNRLPDNLHLFQGPPETIVLKTERVSEMLKELHQREIQSVIVEGGAKLLSSFLKEGLWDEARIFINEQSFGEGVEAPALPSGEHKTEQLEVDQLSVFKNH